MDVICSRCGRTFSHPRYRDPHQERCFFPRTIARLYELGNVVEDCGCWLWNGKGDAEGYLGSEGFVHRFAEECVRGPIPPGVVVCHRCDKPGCFNPAHLFRGTQADNIRDAWDKGRQGGVATWSRERYLAGEAPKSNLPYTPVAAPGPRQRIECDWCGEEFWDVPSARRKYCSTSCAASCRVLGNVVKEMEEYPSW